MVRSRDTVNGTKNYYRKVNSMPYSRGSSSRGRNNYYSRRGYSKNNVKFYSSKHWERPRSRPLSPVEGSEEFMARKIQQTSAIIMRHLLSPNESIASPSKLSNKDTTEIEQCVNTSTNLKENEKKQCENIPSRTRKSSSSKISAKEVHEKIMNRLTNLNDGRKKNFINANNSTGLDSAIQHILKQKRLDLSRILRDMCSPTYNPQQSGELINSIIPDIGIKIEELPLDVIEELRQTLNIDLDEDGSTSNLVPYSQVTVSSDELIAAVDSIQVKSEQIVDLDTANQATCTGSVEIKAEDIVDYEALDDNTEVESIQIEGDTIQVTNKNQNHIDLDNHSVTIKCEPQEDADCYSLSTFSEDTVLYSKLCNQNKHLEGPINNKTRSTSEDNCKQNAELEINCIDKNESKHNQINDNRSNIESGEDASSQTENSLSSVENLISNFIQTDGEFDISDLNEVSQRVDLIDRCIKNLSDYRQSLTKSILKRCYGMQESDKKKEGIDISENKTSNDVDKNFANQSSQIVSNIEKLDEEDKSVTKKRKVDHIEQDLLMKKDAKIKTEKIENDLLQMKDILTFPSMEDRIMVIEQMELQLLLGTEAGNIIYVSIEDGSFLHTLDVTNSPITSIVFVRGMNDFIYMYVGCLDQVLRIYDYRTRTLIKAAPLDNHIRCMDAMWDYVFMGCKGGTLIRYSSKKGKIEFEEKNSGNDILVLKAAQEGPRKVLIVGHRQAPVYVRDAMSGLYLRNFSNEAITPTVYALLVNNNYLYCGTAKDNILVFSFHEGQLLHKLFAAEGKGISCMKIYKNMLFSGCYNGSIYVHQLDTKTLLEVLKGPGGSVLSMEVLNNQVIVGTITGQFRSVEIPEEVTCLYVS